MNLASVVWTFRAPGGLAVTRRAAGTWANGIYTAGAALSLRVEGAAYPAQARELKLLPEGQRSTSAFAFVTQQPLRGVADPGGTPPDRVTFAGILYEIQAVTDWSSAGGYYLSVGVKVPS